MFTEGTEIYSDILAYWKFNDGSGTILSDASPNNNNGNLNNMDNLAWVKSTAPIC
jgi:hypothetical protein